MPLQGEYLPPKTPWVARQLEQIHVAGDTGAVHIQNRPVVVFTIRGRKTGLLRRVPLMRVEHGGPTSPSDRSVGRRRIPPGSPASRRTRMWSCRTAPRPSITCASPGGRSGARRVVGTVRSGLPLVRRLPEEDRTPDPGVPLRAGFLTRAPVSRAGARLFPGTCVANRRFRASRYLDDAAGEPTAGLPLWADSCRSRAH